MNGSHKQLIQVDIIFNYICHVGRPGTCPYTNHKITVFGDGLAGAINKAFPKFYTDIFLEVQHEKCS